MSVINSATDSNVVSVAVAKPHVICDRGYIRVVVSVPDAGDVHTWVSHETGPQGWHLGFEGIDEGGDQFMLASEIEAIVYERAEELAKAIEADEDLTRHRRKVSSFYGVAVPPGLL